MQKSSSQVVPRASASRGIVIVRPSGFCRRPIRLAGGLYRSHTSSAEALSASTAIAAEARSFMVLDSIDRCDGRLQDRPFTAAADLSMNLVNAALGGPKP